MESRDYAAYGSPDFLNTDNNDNYDFTSSTFLWDSPQPEEQTLNFGFDDTSLDYTAGASNLSNMTNYPEQHDFASGNTTTTSPSALMKQPPLLPNGASTAPSVTSEDSSHSSTSDRHQKRETSSTSSPQGGSTTQSAIGLNLDQPSLPVKMESGFGEMADSFQFEESSMPNVGAGIDNLSLSNAGTTTHSPDFKFNAPSPDNMGTGMFGNTGMDYMPHNMGNALRGMHSAGASPQMTIHPSKMFVIGEDNENSPNDMDMMSGMEDSSSAFYNAQSPMGMGDGFNGTLPPDASMRRGTFGNGVNAPFTGVPSSSMNAAHISHKVAGAQPPQKWPCRLTVDAIPDKSRVETQIPIRLTLHNAPKNVTKLHLPSYTISKPKFQAKPPFVKSDDALELSCMLVCASAMQKEGLQEKAFQRAADDDGEGDLEVKTEDGKESTPLDETDPMKPLNGGPVQICNGCIVRERKRAARKKTKKQDEEEEWAKDEAKRVIVFNCAEVRDWCVQGTKETSVKEHEGPVDQCFVTAPMRVACYCRHQSEKVGFQVIFTIRTSEGQVLGQVMSDSIMITDDHKQPAAGQAPPMPFAANPMANTGLFPQNPAFGMYQPTFAGDIPFRTSYSMNDLRSLNQYAPQRRPVTFSRQNSGSYASTAVSTAASTATATPRNLSRPASPTSPSGHSTKKRRSGIGPSHPKLPAGLMMTRMDDGMSTPMSNTPLTAGPTPNFNFNSPAGFSTGMTPTFNQPPMTTPDPYASGPPTPMTNGLPNGMFGSGNVDPYEFYSAPTSQHASRAPSPRSQTRQNSFSMGAVSQQAAFALNSLPPNLNIQKPPTIQRLIPNGGSRIGGDEVTVLGSGFCQGLDVMFGDKVATNTTFWGDTTIVCRAPPSVSSGIVSVVFKHQHHTAPPEMQQMQAIMPTHVASYTYYDAGMQQQQQQLQAMQMGFAMQQQALQQQQQMQNRDLSGLSQEELQRAFAMNQMSMAMPNSLAAARGMHGRRTPGRVQGQAKGKMVAQTSAGSVGPGIGGVIGNGGQSLPGQVQAGTAIPNDR